jgi:branched-chain amino acid transport system ATP-binding protein
MLEVRGLCAGYGGYDVLHDVDVSVGAGEIVALVGANGAGKSTLVKTLTGLLPARAGKILFEGRAIERLSPRDRLASGLSLVPEGRQVFAGLSVEANLRLGAYVAHGLDESAVQSRIAEVCSIFPVLMQRRREPAAVFSGGQQQMLAIARGLMSQPKVLLLDEPSLGLSPTLVADIFRLVAQLRERGLAILLSEQNARQSLAVADRAYVIENGRIVMAGRSADILASDEIAEKYLGVGVARTDSTNKKQTDMTARLKAILRSPSELA